MIYSFTSDELEAGFNDDPRVLEDVPCSKCRGSLTPDEIECSSACDDAPLCDLCFFASIPGYQCDGKDNGEPDDERHIERRRGE